MSPFELRCLYTRVLVHMISIGEMGCNGCYESKLTATDTNIGNTSSPIGNTRPHIGNKRSHIGDIRPHIGNIRPHVANTRPHIGHTRPPHRKHTPSHRKPTPSYRQRTPLRLAFALVSMDSSDSTQSTSGHGIAHSLNTMDFHMSNGFLGFSWLPLIFFL